MNTTALTAKILLVRVDDREGNGRCGACQREGLRWICVLSDGTEVGTECAKAALGYKPTPKTYAWVSDYTAVAERTEGSAVWTLWQAKNNSTTRETLNGNLRSIGGCRQAWERNGWL